MAGSVPWLGSWAGIDGLEQRQLALSMRGWEEGDQGKQHPQHDTGVSRGKHRGVLCLTGRPSLCSLPDSPAGTWGWWAAPLEASGSRGEPFQSPVASGVQGEQPVCSWLWRLKRFQDLLLKDISLQVWCKWDVAG